jgi:hypothetical protein
MNFASHWNSFDLQIAVVLLFTYMLIDAMYAYYTVVVTRKRPLASANISSIMHFLIAFGVLSYTQNYLYVIPIAMGSWVGTYLVVRYDLKSDI